MISNCNQNVAFKEKDNVPTCNRKSTKTIALSVDAVFASISNLFATKFFAQ